MHVYAFIENSSGRRDVAHQSRAMSLDSKRNAQRAKFPAEIGYRVDRVIDPTFFRNRDAPLRGERCFLKINRALRDRLCECT